jgi:tellurite resistance protein TerC
MFIGVKLVLTYVHEIYDPVPKISTGVSLAGVGAILLVSVVASLIKSRRDPTARAHAGRVTSPKPKPAQKTP